MTSRTPGFILSLYNLYNVSKADTISTIFLDRKEKRNQGVRDFREATWLAGVRTEGSGSLVECFLLWLILVSSYSLVTHLNCPMPSCLVLLSRVHMSVLLGCVCGICVLVVPCVP